MHSYSIMKSQVERVLELEGGSYMMDFGMPAPEHYAKDGHEHGWMMLSNYVLNKNVVKTPNDAMSSQI